MDGLDPESREQLRIIAIETSIEETRKMFFERLATIENRVKFLEEARQRQISLNGEYDKRLDNFETTKIPINKPKEPKWKWW